MRHKTVAQAASESSDRFVMRKHQTLVAIVLLGGGVVGFDQFVVRDSGPSAAEAGEPGADASRTTIGLADGHEDSGMLSVANVLETLRDRVEVGQGVRADAFAVPSSWMPVEQTDEKAGSAAPVAESPITPEQFADRHVVKSVEQRVRRAGNVTSTFTVATLDDGREIGVVDVVDGFRVELITSEFVRFANRSGMMVELKTGGGAEIKRK